MQTRRKPISLRTRFTVLRAAGFRCVYCGKRPPEAVLQLDHRVPVTDGGTDDPANLVASCTACNQGKGACSSEVPLPAWTPVYLEGLVIPGRCDDGEHPGPWQEFRYGPPQEPASEIALVCPKCRYIVARRPVSAGQR